MIRSKIFIIAITLFATNAFAQEWDFTRQDTLRGTITPERAWWDLMFYHLSIDVNPEDSSFCGSNLIGYRVKEANKIMQIDLQAPMKITGIIQEKKELKFERDGNACFVELGKSQPVGSVQYL